MILYRNLFCLGFNACVTFLMISDMVNSGVVLIGETRSLLASLPQSILDLFTQKLTFGMLNEAHRLR